MTMPETGWWEMKPAMHNGVRLSGALNHLTLVQSPLDQRSRVKNSNAFMGRAEKVRKHNRTKLKQKEVVRTKSG